MRPPRVSDRGGCRCEPYRGARSSSINTVIEAAFANRTAADSPATPPPTITTLALPLSCEGVISDRRQPMTDQVEEPTISHSASRIW